MIKSFFKRIVKVKNLFFFISFFLCFLQHFSIFYFLFIIFRKIVKFSFYFSSDSSHFSRTRLHYSYFLFPCFFRHFLSFQISTLFTARGEELRRVSSSGGSTRFSFSLQKFNSQIARTFLTRLLALANSLRSFSLFLNLRRFRFKRMIIIAGRTFSNLAQKRNFQVNCFFCVSLKFTCQKLV